MHPHQMASQYDEICSSVVDRHLAMLSEYNLSQFEEPLLTLRANLIALADDLRSFPT